MNRSESHIEKQTIDKSMKLAEEREISPNIQNIHGFNHGREIK
jgi:hypothetical protein